MNFKIIIFLFVSLCAGMILASMIFLNSILAKYTNPLWASFVAHGVGAIVAFFAFLLLEIKTKKYQKNKIEKFPYFIYLAGIPGAFTVILSSITVNSGLALSGSLSFMLLGQVAFSLYVDSTGFLGIPIRKIRIFDIFEVLSILVGSAILIFFSR